MNQSQEYSNRYTLNGIQQEYGLCTYNPMFYVAILNTHCTPLQTKIQSNPNGYTFGNWNENGHCRQRPERYFIYRQQDTTDLTNLDSLLNYWLPNDYYIAIWTPLSYNYNQVNSVCPALGTTLVSFWGNEIKADSMVVLFGKVGDPSSYTLDTTIVDGEYIFAQRFVCTPPNLGIDKNGGINHRELIRIVDIMGQDTKDEPNKLLFLIYSDGTVEKVYRLEY